MSRILETKTITDYLDENNILWQPVWLQGKNVVKHNGIIPREDDYLRIEPEEFKKRQKIDSEYIAIYTEKVQQFNVEIRNYTMEDIPYFLSIKKQHPHYFIKTSFERTHANTEVECPVACGTILNGKWSYAVRDSLVFNSNTKPVEIEFNNFRERLPIKLVREMCKRINKMAKTGKLNRNKLENMLCLVLNSSVEACFKNPYEIVHSAIKDTCYDNEEIINFINKIKYSEDGLKYNEFIKIAREQENYSNDDEIAEEDGISFFKDKVCEYSEFKKEWEKIAFYCVCQKKIIYHAFDGFILSSDLNPASVYYTISQVPVYGDIYRYGLYNTKGEFKQHIDLWLTKEKTKLQYDNYDFLPNPFNVPNNTFNLWNGFNRKIYEYTEEEKLYAIDVFTKFIEHVGSSHKDLPHFLTQLIANIVQNPGMKEGIVLIFTGAEGTYKGTYSRLMKSIIGSEYTIDTTDPEKVLGRFNHILMKKLFCCLNEAVSYEIIEKNSKIKGLATDIELNYEQKGQPIVQGHNFTRLLICTNENIGAKDSQGGRRNVYIETTKMPDDIRISINNVIDSELYSYIIFEYLKNDIKICYHNSQEWSRNRPITEKHNQIIEHFTDPVYSFIGSLCKKKETKFIPSKDFNTEYSRYMDKYPKMNKKTPRELAFFINKLIKDSEAIIRGQNKNGVKGYKIDCKNLHNYLVKKNFIKKEEDLPIFKEFSNNERIFLSDSDSE